MYKIGSPDQAHLSVGVWPQVSRRLTWFHPKKFWGLKKNQPLKLLLMEEILHQSVGSLSVYPIIYNYEGLNIPGGAGFLPSTVSLELFQVLLKGGR